MKNMWLTMLIITALFIGFFAGNEQAKFKPSQVESAQANEEQEFSTYVIGGCTLLALLVQCFIFARQTSVMKRTAELTEDAMTIAKWPYLYIKQAQFITPLGGPRASIPPVFEYWMVVFGESHAIIRRLYQKLVFTENPPSPAGADEIEWETPDWFIKQGDGWEREVFIADTRETAKEAWGSPKSVNRKYYFVGCVIYDDVFGNQHELAFCYWGPRAGGGGLKYGGNKYNYHKRRSEDDRL